jgi:hypothetical protein
VEQRVNPALLVPPLARCLDEIAGKKLDPAPLLVAGARLLD